VCVCVCECVTHHKYFSQARRFLEVLLPGFLQVGMSFLITQTESSSPPPTVDTGPIFEFFFLPLPEENLNNLGSSLAFLFSIVRGVGMFLLITLFTCVFLLTF
jgi:hypothetical protein